MGRCHPKNHRRFSIEAESLVLTYVDDDDDTITVSTILELQEAVRDGIKRFDLLFAVIFDSSASNLAAEDRGGNET